MYFWSSVAAVVITPSAAVFDTITKSSMGVPLILRTSSGVGSSVRL